MKIMWRSGYFFLIILLFLSSNMSSKGQNLVLTQVSIDTVYPQMLKLKWLFTPAADSVSIYKCESYCSYENNFSRVAKVIMEVEHLEWIDINADLTTSYTYSIGWNYSGKSAPLNNMVLKTASAAVGCSNSILLSWNPYIRYKEFSWDTGTNKVMDSMNYYVYYRLKGGETTFILLDSLLGICQTSKINYEAKYLLSDTVYEFVVQAFSINDPILYSFSNISVAPRTGIVNLDPVAIEISCISVIYEKNFIIDIITESFSDIFHKLYLLRDKPDKIPENKESLSFSIIDSTDYNPNNQYTFIDNKVDPKSGLYYYMVVADNKCKLNDTSNILTNIYLYGKRVEKYGDSIFFVQQGFPPLNPNDIYEVNRRVDGSESNITSLTLLNNRCYVDVEPFLEDGIVVKYVVKSDNNCYSNPLTIEHEPKMKIPNAFYPESRKIENQTFFPILSFPPENNYLFIIYNRWGQEIFRATKPPHYCFFDRSLEGAVNINMSCLQQNKDEQRSWDGTFQGKKCPPGIYAYKISYAFNEGSELYSTSGTFMLMR